MSLDVHGLSAMSVYRDAIFVRLLFAMGLIAVLAVFGIVVIVAIRLSTNLATPGWATTVAGDLLIILSQSFVIVVAASLTMLVGAATARSSRSSTRGDSSPGASTGGRRPMPSPYRLRPRRFDAA